MKPEERKIYTNIGNIGIIDLDMDGANEADYMYLIHSFEKDREILQKKGFEKVVLLVNLDNFKFTLNMIRQTALNAKNKVHLDGHVPYGKINKILFTGLQLVSKILPKKILLFRNRFEAIEHIKNTDW